jgi:hypothetical protein
VAIAGIRQHYAYRDLLRDRLPYLIQSNLWFGLKTNLLGNPGLLATFAILRPCFWQVQPPRNRQTRTPRRYRQTHGCLAIVGFASLAAILSGDPHRVLALFRKTGVIHDPRHHRTMFLYRRQHFSLHLCQHLLIVPGRIGYQVMERLVHATHILGRQSCGHRFNALAFTRQQQTYAVMLQRHMPVSVPCGFCQALDICRKALFLWAWRSLFTHETILHQIVFL